MKRYLAYAALVLSVLVPGDRRALAASAPEIPAQSLGIVPEPLSVKAFAITYTLPGKVSIAASNKAERNVAAFLTAFLKARGISSTVVRDSNTATIHLSTDANDPSIGSEGYHLTVADSGIMITANAGAGLFYGLQTLEQLFPPPPGTSEAIHQVQITDKPQYQWRGLMLDVSRHYFPVPFIKQLIDVAAAYKLNTFHWHLVDNPAWRIEIKKYPRLTQVGSCGDYDHPLGTGPCQFYTQKEIRDIVAYAQKRYVRMLPEIEIPGHSAAALAAYPDLACKPIVDSVYCPSPQTFQFLENVLDEVMKLFPGTDIHTGGDEVSPEAWNASSVAQAVMQKNHLSDAHALQGWFDRRIEDYLTQHGHRMVGWDEVLAGGVSKNAVIMSWRGTNGGIAAAVKGNDVVMSPGDWLYFNAYQGPSAWEPLGTDHLDTLEHVYTYGPDLRSLSPEEKSRILGPEGALWTEFVPTPDLAWYRLFPRTLALAEMGWTASALRDWTSFQQRTSNQYPRLEARNIPFYIPVPFELKDTVTENDHIAVTLTSPVPDSRMYYTLDGSYPTTSSAPYQTPITITLNPGQELHLRVVTALSDGRASAPSEAGYMRRLQNTASGKN